MKNYLNIFILLLLSFPGHGQAIEVDTAITYQTMEGFGASDAWRPQFVGKNWPMEKREQIADWLFSKEFDAQGNPKGIGLSIWRYYIGAGTAEQGNASGIENEWRRAACFLQSNGTFDWTKQEGQRWFLNAAKQRGVEKFLAFTIAPPVFMSINGKGYSIKDDPRMNVQPGKMEDYAHFLLDVLQHFEYEGIGFDYLSPFNEPQWDWSKASQEGTAATNEDIYLLVNYLSKELRKRKMKTELVIGEAASIEYLYAFKDKPIQGNQIETFFDPESALYLGDLPQVKPLITGHSYFTTWPINEQVEKRKQLKSKLDEIGGLGYWQTEFSILEESPEIGSGHNRDLGMNTALYVARVIHSDLTIANASSWQWWTALTTFDFKDGLIYLDTGKEIDRFNLEELKLDGVPRDSKLMWTLGNYSRFVCPGMVRIEAVVKGNDQLQVSAYKSNDGKLVFVIINHGKEPVPLELYEGIDISGIYITDEQRNLERQQVSGSEPNIPPRSVVTIVGNI